MLRMRKGHKALIARTNTGGGGGGEEGGGYSEEGSFHMSKKTTCSKNITITSAVCL